MAREFETVAAEATIEGAAQIMAELDVVVLPVRDQDALVGILTERDITIRVVAAGRVPADTKVAEIMSSDVFSCRPDDDADAIARAMRERKIRQVPVLDDEGRLIGLVTLAALQQGGEREVDATVAPRTPAESEAQ
ncbi:MAG TPA: CBS domain-containing protein [Alphaproteobacteria bacterium]|nr:CBS domain-containing protein [Alphaproteobacteria bacterium]